MLFSLQPASKILKRCSPFCKHRAWSCVHWFISSDYIWAMVWSAAERLLLEFAYIYGCKSTGSCWACTMVWVPSMVPSAADEEQFGPFHAHATRTWLSSWTEQITSMQQCQAHADRGRKGKEHGDMQPKGIYLLALHSLFAPFCVWFVYFVVLMLVYCQCADSSWLARQWFNIFFYYIHVDE